MTLCDGSGKWSQPRAPARRGGCGLTRDSSRTRPVKADASTLACKHAAKPLDTPRPKAQSLLDSTQTNLRAGNVQPWRLVPGISCILQMMVASEDISQTSEYPCSKSAFLAASARARVRSLRVACGQDASYASLSDAFGRVIPARPKLNPRLERPTHQLWSTATSFSVWLSARRGAAVPTRTHETSSLIWMHSRMVVAKDAEGVRRP